MSKTSNSSADHLQSAVAVATSPPFSFGGWFKSTLRAQSTRFIVIGKSNDNQNFFGLGMNDTAGTGELAAMRQSFNGTTAVADRALSIPIPVNAWFHALMTVGATNRVGVYCNGANKGSSSVSVIPLGVNATRFSGRLTDGSFPLFGEFAMGFEYSRELANIEASFLGLLGGHPRALTGLQDFWRIGAIENPVLDQVGSNTLSVFGTTAGADDPTLAPFFTGAAIGDQSWTTTVAITPIAVSAGFDVLSPATPALYEVGASTGSATTNAAGTATRFVTLTAATGLFAAGDYMSVGAGAQCAVLAVQGSTLLVAQDQSYASGATVTRFPAAPTSIAGCALSAGSYGGAPTTPQVQTAGYFFRNICNADATRFADSNLFKVTVTAIVIPPPSFAVTPSVLSTTPGGYVVGFTPSAAATAFLGAYARGATPPTIAQLKVGTGALATASKGVTAADSLTVTGLDFPTHDLYAVLNNAQGDSALVALINQLKSPPVGSAYRILTSVAAGTPYAGVASIGDIEESQAILSPSAAPVTLLPDGNDVFVASGRQSRSARLYGVTGRAWYLDSIGGQFYTVWYNDLPPTFATPSVPYAFPAGAAITPVNLSALFQSPSADIVTVTALDPLPPGLSVSGNQLSGTPSGNATATVRLTGIDKAGASVAGVIQIITGVLLVPPVFDLDSKDGVAQITAAFLKAAIVPQDDSGPPNIILGQFPLAGTPVAPFTVVTITVSRTPAGQLPSYGLRNHSFQCVPSANGDLDMHHPSGS